MSRHLQALLTGIGLTVALLTYPNQPHARSIAKANPAAPEKSEFSLSQAIGSSSLTMSFLPFKVPH